MAPVTAGTAPLANMGDAPVAPVGPVDGAAPALTDDADEVDDDVAAGFEELHPAATVSEPATTTPHMRCIRGRGAGTASEPSRGAAFHPGASKRRRVGAIDPYK